MKYALLVLDVIVGVGLVVLVFMHSGKDAGLSATFGGVGGAFGGTTAVQKNLDRFTIGFAVAFFVITIALGFVV
ncbi:MAG: preprotein translocase subunit SecG [Gaiellales bacterium]|nr:preprotein translocase subunit SecG [Gaiellales bacterium]